MDQNFIFCFAVAKTVSEELENENLFLKELISGCLINFLKSLNQKNLSENKNFKIYENYLLYKNLISAENLNNFHFGLDNSDYEKNIKFYQNNPNFKACFNTAKKIIKGIVKDKSFGSTHYHKADEFPKWATGHGGIIQEEKYIFYNDILM